MVSPFLTVISWTVVSALSGLIATLLSGLISALTLLVPTLTLLITATGLIASLTLLIIVICRTALLALSRLETGAKALGAESVLCLIATASVGAVSALRVYALSLWSDTVLTIITLIT